MTDVIEDAENILQRAIDILDVFLNRLIERLNQNSHRPLTRRTLLRWIAAFFPSPVNPRIKIQRDLGFESHLVSRWASCGSLSSGGGNQLVEEDLGDNIVRYRMAGTDYPEDNVFDDTTNTFMESEEWKCWTSTPNRHNASSCSSLASTRDSDAQSKISEMEGEMAALRRQIALLVVAQENTTLSNTVTGESNSKGANISQVAAVPLPVSPTSSHSPNDSGCDTNRPLSCCSDEAADPPLALVPPPPPPPPPPLPPKLMPKNSSQLKSTVDASDLLKKRNSLTKVNEQAKLDGSNKDVLTLSDVLKGLSSVKLKTVERSPGGTPFRAKPRSDPSDPASIIALALKKKFARHHGFFSPESDKENETSFSSPDQITPKNPKAARRLSLLAARDDSDSWTPVAPALHTINA